MSILFRKWFSLPLSHRLILARIGRGQNAVDVGANAGYYSQFLSVLGANVIAYEPICEPKYIKGVRWRRVAVGSSSDTIQVAVGKDARQSSVTGEVLGGIAYIKQVQQVALDDEALPRPISLIKTDTQGMDMEVLLGAKNILREDNPLVLTECSFDLLKKRGYSAGAMIDFMIDLGYTFRVVSREEWGVDLLFEPA